MGRDVDAADAQVGAAHAEASPDGREPSGGQHTAPATPAVTAQPATAAHPADAPATLPATAAAPAAAPAVAAGTGPSGSAGAAEPEAGAARTPALLEAMRPFVGLLANVTVITALLVYFGWRRAETHAAALGIDESLLGMSTREYVLRSVGPVLLMLVVVSVGGLLWLSVERRLTPQLRPAGPAAPDRTRRARTVVIRLCATAWLWLPAIASVLRLRWPALAFVLFPASIGVGALLWLYARRLARTADTAGANVHHDTAALALVGMLALVCLFWTASNYAEVLGTRLARDFALQVARQPGVALYSGNRLYLDGPGVVETRLSAPGEEAPTYRYTGLRLLEHTGSRYFLVSDEWTRRYGVVFVFPDADPSLRFEFVRDTRP